jgi:hypothetical protein
VVDDNSERKQSEKTTGLLRWVRFLFVPFISFVVSFWVLEFLLVHPHIYLPLNWSLAWAFWTLAVQFRGKTSYCIIAGLAGTVFMANFLWLSGFDFSVYMGA